MKKEKHVSDFLRFTLYSTNLLSMSRLVELKDVSQNDSFTMKMKKYQTIMNIWFKTYPFLIVDPNYFMVFYVVVQIQ